MGVAGTIFITRESRSDAVLRAPTQRGSLTRDGWTLSVPATWHAQTVPACREDHLPAWIVVTDTTHTFTGRYGASLVCAQGPSLAGFPADGAALALWPIGGISGFAGATASMPLPLTQDFLQLTGGIKGGPQQAYAEAGGFTVTTWTGEHASATARAELARVLGSVRIAGAKAWTAAHDGGFSFPLPSDWRVVRAGDTPSTAGLLAIESPPYGRVHGGTVCSKYPIKDAAGTASGIAVWMGSPRTVSGGTSSATTAI